MDNIFEKNDGGGKKSGSKLTQKDYDQVINELKERVKEQACLYNISSVDVKELSEEIFFNKIIEYLQQAFQFPELAEIAVLYKNNRYTSKGYKKKKWDLVFSSEIGDGNRLEVRANYRKKPKTPELFLPEEKLFLDTLTDLIAFKLSQKEVHLKRERDQNTLEKILNQSLDVICTINEKGEFVKVSQASKWVWGYDPEELEGKVFIDLVHPEDIEKTNKAFEEVMSGVDVTNFENLYMKKDGSVVPIIWSARWDGNDRLMYCVAKDATERIKGEEIIAGERKRYEKLFQQMPAFVSMMEGPEHRNVMANPVFCQITGRSEDELRGKTAKEAFPELVDQGIIEILDGVYSTGKPFEIREMEVYVEVTNGQGPVQRFYDFVYLPNRGIDDSIEGILAFGMDVTHQMEARKSLKTSNERFEYALKVSDDVIYDHDMLADTISLSENFQHIFGYSFADEPFTLEKWAKLLHPDDEQRIESRLNKTLANKSENKWEAEFRYQKKDGTYANVKESAYIIRDDAGQPVRMIGTVKDITEAKHRELKKELSSNISRDFNESDTLRVALNKALNELKTLGDFKFAEIWLVNHDRSAIELSSYIEKNNEQFYKSESDKDSFKKGKGLPGKTWKSGKVQFWENLDSRKSFIRRAGAEKSDLKTGYGFPVTYNNEVTGVLVLGADKKLQKPQPFAGILEELAEQLGEEIHRKKLEEELSRIFSSAPDGIIVAGFDGYFKKVNPAVSEILGYSEEELLNTPFIELVHPDDRERTLNMYDEVNSGSEKFYFENRYITKPGQVVWLSWTFKVFLEEGVAYSVAKNITDQKKLEHLLEQANKLSKIGPWEVDLIKNEIYWSDITREILGVGPEVEPSMEKGLDLYKEGESRDRMSGAIRQAIEKGTSWDIEVQIVPASGNEKWVRSIGEAEFVQGKCVRLYGSLQDIHEKKELEELLAQSNRLAKIGSWEVNLVNEKLFWSEITREIHEVNPDYEPVLESAINFYKEGKSRDAIWQAINHTIETGEGWDLELQIVTAKGNERWIRAIGEADMADGKCVRIYGSFQDIHDRKIAERRLISMADNLPGVMFQYWLTPDGKDRVHYLSEGSNEIWGVSAADAMEDFDRVWAGVHNEDVEGIRQSIVESAESLKQWHYVWRYNHPNGSLRWQEGFGTPQKLADGTIVWDSIVLDITERKELEHLLEQSAKMARIGSWEVDLIEGKSYWSDITREIHEVESGFQPELGERINFYKAGENREKIQRAVNRAIEEGEPFDLELQIVTAKGNERWVRAIGEAELIDGKPVRIYGSFQDIHDRKVVEEELKEKTAHIDAIAQLNAALLNYQDWFGALERHLEVIGKAVVADRVYFFENRFDPDTEEGYTTQKLEWCREGIESQLGNPDLDEIPFSDVPELVEPMIDRKPSTRKLSDVPKGSVTEYVMLEQQMKTFLAIPIYIKDHFHGFVGFDNCTIEKDWSNEEMTTLKTIASNLAIAIERQKADEKLQSAFEEKNTILESIGDGFFALDDDFTVNYWNSRAEELLFTPKEKVLNRSLWDAFDKNLAPKSFQQYSEALKERKVLKFEDYYEPIDKWFDVNVYPSVNGVSVFFKDITERKQAEEQLKNLNQSLEQKANELASSNAELEQFAFVASHDLQEPLRMITSFLAQLERKYDSVLDEKGRRYIHFATDGARRMRQIILDLLDYSRVGRVDNERSEVDVNDILEDVTVLNRKLIQEKHAKVNWEKMPVIYAAKGPIKQLFQNLVHNGLYYQEQGNKPKVNIRCEESDLYWKFYIEDNGIGINHDYTEKIFNIFQRLHGKEQYSGTGVGLAICQKIVEDHGGEIGVDSEEGKGSVFYFTISKPESS